MNIFVNIVGVSLIAFTYWFFFMKKGNKAVEVSDEIEILVQGGYKPDVIKVKKGKSVTLKFNRKDPSSCLEEVVIPDFGIRQYLKLNDITEVKLNPHEAGEFEISCGMNMFHGKIIVE